MRPSFAVSLAALALGLTRRLPPGDHRTLAAALVTLASTGALAGALTRNSCEESLPRCKGETFATRADWLHAIGGLAEVFGIAGAALVVASVLPRPWASYSTASGCMTLLGFTLAEAVPYPWMGTAQRLTVLVLAGWVAAFGIHVTSGTGGRPVDG